MVASVFWFSQSASRQSTLYATVKSLDIFLLTMIINYTILCSLGCLVMCNIAFNIIVSIISFTIGLVYFILSLIPSLPPPNGFLIHWQHRQDFWAEGMDLTVPSPFTVYGPHPSAWHPPIHPPAMTPIDYFHKEAIVY